MPEDNTHFGMATITASLSSRKDARGKSEILLRFVGGRDNIYRLHSRLWVDPARWKDGGFIIPRIETKEQQELKASKKRLDDLRDFLLERFAGADRVDVSKDWMQEQVEIFHHPERERDGKSFFGLLDEFTKSKDVSEVRGKRYAVTIRALKRFEAWRGRKLTVEGVDAATLEDFRAFLGDEHEICRQKKWKKLYKAERRMPEERSKNAIIEYFDVIRTFYHWMNGRGVTQWDPFKSFQAGASVYGTPYYLTIEEREQLRVADLEGTPTLAVQRDIFVFQCLVGCRVGDLVRFRKGDVVDGVLTYMPRKTMEGHPVVVRVPLVRQAQEIVERYSRLRGDQLLPCISPQKYNDALKKIFKAAGVTRVVTILDPLTREEVKKPLNEVASSHLARRTFIGNLYKQVKDPALIGSLSGHAEGSKSFARYRSIDDEMKTDLVKLLEGKQDGK